MTKAKPAPGHKVLRDDAISDGKGGYLKKGDTLPATSAETIDSLKAKGLI